MIFTNFWCCSRNAPPSYRILTEKGTPIQNVLNDKTFFKNIDEIDSEHLNS